MNARDKDAPAYLEHKQIVPILIGLMAGMFLAALDQTIVATAIRTIGDDLNGLSLQAWVTTAYLITSTVTTPLYGKFSDIYGRKPLFLFAITVFILGSAACTFAGSMYSLAIFRAVQGIGAGGLFTLALAIIGDIVPPRERAKYQGYFLAVFGTSSVLGPVIGGFFAGTASILGVDGWRWVFLVNVPIGIIALTIVSRTLHIPNFVRHDHRIDWGGVAGINLFLVPLLLLAERGRAWGWTSTTSMTLYAAAVIGLTSFVYSERRMGDEAIIPLRLFKDRTFSVVAIAGMITGAGFFGGLLLLPLYLQIVQGDTPTQSGLKLIPLTLGIMFSSILSGQLISRRGRYKPFPVGGTLIVLGALLLMTRITVDTGYWTIAGMSMLFGLGMGFLFQPLVLAVQNTVSPRDIGVGTSSVTLFRQLGGTLGTAVFLSVYFDSVPGHVAKNFTKAAADPGFQAAASDPANASTVSLLQQLRSGGVGFDDTSWLSQANRILIRPVLDGFAQSQQLVFTIAAAIVALGVFAVVWLPNVPLKERDAKPVAE